MGITENAYFQTIVTQVLHRITREESIMLATITSGRQLSGMERMVGMFVNTIPLTSVSQTKDSQTFAEAARAMHRQSIESVSRDFYPLTEVVERHGLRPQILYAYQGGLYDGVNLDEDDRVSDMPLTLDTQKLPIELTVFPNGKDGYTIGLFYDTAVYSRQDMEIFVHALANYAVHATKEGTRLSDIELTTEEEQAELIRLGTGEKRDYDTTKTLIDLFRVQAERTPDAVAVVDKDSQYSYQELDIESNILANILIEEGINAGDHVCVELPRRKEFLLAVFGIMKAGAAYVPIDMDYPDERKQFIIEDSEAKLVIDKAWMNSHTGDDTSAVNLTEDTDTAYIIYTSGSTGKPKGVMVPHGAFSHFLQFIADEWCLFAQSRISCHASFAFDASVEDLYPVLTVGGTVCIVPEEATKDIHLLYQFMVDNRITGGTFTTQLGEMLLEEYPDLPVDYLVVGGERMTKNPSCHCRLINTYGPTEFTVDATYYELEPERHYDSIPIGRPLHNQTAYIIDSNNHLLPRGMAGELCMSGIQMASGYWKRDELTEELFTDIIVDGKPIKVYRTGDLCRWNEQGELEYLRRIDNQVKLRGFRIELGEIESQSLMYDGIRQAVATVHDGQLLCLYYTADNNIDEGALKEFLAQSLPDYMVPAAYIHLEELPLTPNGKVDRKKLPAPDITSDTEYIVPEGETEEKVAAVFAEVLNLTSPVGALDDFFYLGGDSIKSIRLVSRLRSMGLVTQVSDVMRLKTVRAIAEAAKYEDEMAVPQEAVSGEIRPNAIQQAFLCRNLSKPEHFNQAIALRILRPVNAVLLRQALEALSVHHDMLRAVVRDGRIIVRDSGDGALMGFCEPDELNAIDLENGPLFKASLCHAGDGDILLLACHHISCDGVSWRILTEDLNTAYRQLLDGKPVKLPPKTHSFAHYTQLLRDYRDSYLLMREKPYWQKVQENLEHLPLTGMPAQRGKRQTLDVSLSGEPLRQLLTTASHAYNTDVNDLLVTALCQAYRQVTGQADVAIQMEGHGREPMHEPLMTDRTVGWFTSVYPVVAEGITGDIRHDIRLVKEAFRSIPNKGMGYGILQYIESNKGDEPLRTDLMPLIGFNYLGQMEENRSDDLLVPTSDMSPGQTVATENASFAPSMDINCIVEEGTFHADMTYDTAVWTDSQAQALADAFIIQLQTIAEHTAKVTRTEPTASDFGAEGWTDKQYQAIMDRFAARREAIERVYPLTPMQEAMLLEFLKDNSTTVYREVFRYAIDVLPTEQALRHTMDWLADRHETLRTAILYEGVPEPCQAIVSRSLPVAFIDLTDKQDIDKAAGRIHRELLHQPLNLQEDPLFGLVCLKTSDSSCQLIFHEHHIITDGWSLPIYMGDFLSKLVSEMQGRQLSAYPIEHGRHERFVRSLYNKDMTAGLAYWKGLLQGYETQAAIPAYRKPTEAEVKNAVPRISSVLDAGMTDSLQSLAAKAHCTLNTVMELAWGLTLHACCRTNDAVFAKVVSGRGGTDMKTDGIVGLFINSVPVRVRTGENDTVTQALKNLQAQAAESATWDFCPLAQIQAQTDLGQALFQSTMVFENYPVPQGMDETLEEWNFRPVQTEEEPFN
ncbi:MAG: amino acid adenylation domain-containing protein, partial [Prevotella sp.]|nr:amino acid adenylation domain-containing protein [Prevotella sp.]